MSVRWVRRALILLLLLTGAGLAVADLFTGSKELKTASPAPPIQFVLVEAAHALPPGSVIRSEDLVLRRSAVAPVHGVFLSIADAKDRIALRHIAKTEPVSDANTSTSVKEANLANLIPPGLRAVTLRVTEESAVANFVRPGDHVDVFVISNAARSQSTATSLFPPAEALAVLQNVPVLAVGNLIVEKGNSGSNIRNVTLTVTPRQAAIVALIRTVGSEYLTLRAQQDESEFPNLSVSTADIDPAKPVAQAAVRIEVQRRVHDVEIISGASSNTTRVAIQGDQK